MCLDLNILLEISLNLDAITQRLQTSQPEISPGGHFSLIYSQFGPRVAPDRLREQLRFLMSKEGDGRGQCHNIQPATPSPLRVWTYPNITATLATIGLDLVRASYGLVELPGVYNFLLYFCDRDLNALDQPRLALADSAGRLIHHRNGYRLHHVNHKWLIYQAGTKLYVDYIENCHDGTDRTAKIVTAELDLAEVKLIHTRILGLHQDTVYLAHSGRLLSYVLGHASGTVTIKLGLNLAIDLYLVSCHGRVCQYLIGNDRRPYHCYFDPENGFLPRHEPRQYFQTDDTNVYHLGNGAVIGHEGDNSYYRTIIYTADGDSKVITEEYQGFRRWFRFKSCLRLFSNGSLIYLEEGGQVFRPGDIVGKLSELKVMMY